MAGKTQDEMLTDIMARLEANGKALTADEVRTMIKTEFDGLATDDKFVRKMRFGGEQDDKLSGSKFARYGLNAADIEWAYDIFSSLRGQTKVGGGGQYKGPSEELENAFKAVSDAYYLSDEEVKRVDQRAIDDVYERVPKSAFRAMGTTKKKAYEQSMRAATMDTSQSGFGTQLVGAQYVGDMWDAAFQESVIMTLLQTFEMTAPTAYLPVAVDMPEPLFVSESTSDVLATAQYPSVRTGSQRVQVDAKKFIIHQVFSGEMNEDSIVPLIPFYRQQAARSLAFFGDSAILNGDTATGANTNINLIDSTPGSTKFYLAYNGLRKVGLIDNTANKTDAAGAVTLALLRKLKTLMLDAGRYVDWGHPNVLADLVYIADPITADRIATLDEVLQAKVELGNQAGLLNGQIAMILGNPVLSTVAMSLTDATGQVSNTGSNNVKGQVVSFNKNGAVLGWRRRVQIESERIPASDQTRIVYTYRNGLGRFNPAGNVSAQEFSANLYNIDVS
jgi:hypothetical protein